MLGSGWALLYRFPGGSSTVKPLYSWNNTLNGAQLNTTKEGLGNACVRFQNVHMIENRDFYNEAKQFDGRVGIGTGLLSNAHRPAFQRQPIGLPTRTRYINAAVQIPGQNTILLTHTPTHFKSVVSRLARGVLNDGGTRIR